MVRLRKEKILASFVVVIMLMLAVGNVKSLATAPITATSPSANTTNTGATVLTNNNTANIGATDRQDEASTNTNSSNTNSSRNSSNTNSSKNSTNSTKSSNKLPYAGTNGTVVFVVIALAASAIYAYKKVSDYNI